MFNTVYNKKKRNIITSSIIRLNIPKFVKRIEYVYDIWNNLIEQTTYPPEYAYSTGKYLDLSKMDLAKWTVKQIQDLNIPTFVKELDLSVNDLSDCTVEQIRALRIPDSVAILDLSNNNVEKFTVKQIRALSHNAKIIMLPDKFDALVLRINNLIDSIKYWIFNGTNIKQAWSNVKMMSKCIEDYFHFLRNNKSAQLVKAKNYYYSARLCFIARRQLLKYNLEIVDDCISNITKVSDKFVLEIFSAFTVAKSITLQIRFLELVKKADLDQDMKMLVERIVKNHSPDKPLTGCAKEIACQKQQHLLGGSFYFWCRDLKFFNKVSKSILINNKNTFSKAQHAFDKNFGLMVRS